MERDKYHFRHLILWCFDQKKSAAGAHRAICETYGDPALSLSTCEFWFRRFKNGDFDVSDKERSGQPKKFEDDELQSLLDENPAQTLNELAEALGVGHSAVSDRLKAMGKIQKEGKWLPHELTEIGIQNRYNTCVSLLSRQKKKHFLHQIVTGDEKWIHYDNPKRRKSWVDPGQPSVSAPKRDIHGSKVMLCIWWDSKGVVYYELLKPNETIDGNRYRRQLHHMNQALIEKRPIIANKPRKVILLHDNARPHVAKTVKEKLLQLGWEILPHAPYSPDIAPSNYHLFRSMQHALVDTHFQNLDQVKKWIDDWIASKPLSFYYNGIHSLPEKWEKVVANNGKYFD